MSDLIDITTLRVVPRTLHGDSVAWCTHPDLGIDFDCRDTLPHDRVLRDIYCGDCGAKVAVTGPIWESVLDGVRTREETEFHAAATASNARWRVMCERCGTPNILTSRQS